MNSIKSYLSSFIHTLSLQQAECSDSTPDASKVTRDWVEKTSSRLLQSGLGSSMVLSPVSIAPVLGMLLVGMDNQDDKEKLLGLPRGSLTEELETQIHRELGAYSRAHPFSKGSAVATVNFLTSMCPSPGQAVIDTLQGAYDTEIQIVSPDSDSNVAKITDEYVSDKTAGRITNAFGDASEAMYNQAVLVLGNVLNFQGFWADPFDKSETSADKFYCLDGSVINNVQMMHQRSELGFAEYIGFEAVAKGFDSDDGQPLTLVVIKPGSDSTNSLSRLSSDVINDLIDMSIHAEEQVGYLDLPRIQIKHTDNKLLESQASATGFEITSQNLGNFNVCKLDGVNSQSTINVTLDEAGARGSVATTVCVTRSLSMPQQFTLNCPGYFAIVDDSGNRLVEAMITDGRFLTTDGPARITPSSKPSGNNDALPNGKPRLNGLPGERKTSFSEKSSKSAEPVFKLRHHLETHLGTFDRSRRVGIDLVQSKLNPGRELNIVEVLNGGDELRIEVESWPEAKALKTKILELIGSQYADTVDCIKVADCLPIVDVILYNEGMEEFYKCLKL